MTTPLRVLVVEDSPDDAELALLELRRGGYQPQSRRVETPDAMAAALADGQWDLILCDYSMPRFSAPAALEMLKGSALDIPFIVVSGAIGEDTAVELMRAGAHDYLMKDNLARLAPAVGRELAEAEHRRKRRKAEQALEASEQQYRTLVESVRDGIYLLDRQGRFTFVNDMIVQRSGRPREWFIGRSYLDVVVPEDRQRLEKIFAATMAGQAIEPYETAYRGASGELRHIEVNSALLFDGDEVVGLLAVSRDITERRQIETQYRQAQKMEAVGQLAGGIAHDFRNQLTVIRGLAETLLRRSLVADEGRDRVARILKAAGRSAKLTAQLLAFSRKEMLEPQVTDLSDLVADLGRSLPQMIGEDIRLSITRSTRACHANVDPNLLQQAVINLAINARDAMPNGGELIIETDIVDLDVAAARRMPGAKPGRFCVLLVKDSGTGMPEAVQKRIFEPFFTTKEVGRGTGLGLSMVYGFVKQSGGYVDCRSTPGKGTRLTLFFPWTGEAVAESETSPRPQDVPGGTETVLVVEDEPSVRAALVESLQEGGYRVLVAQTGRDALVLAKQHDGPIHMLVTDVIMPDMNGPELAERIRTSRPNIASLYVSGYAQGDLSRRGAETVWRNLLVKPFTHDQLLRRVRDALDARARDAHSAKP